jgi:hypothetical protein
MPDTTSPTPVTQAPNPPSPNNPPSNRTRGPKSRQNQLTLRDIDTEIAVGGSSVVAQQAALLPSVNISNHGHVTRARSTRTRPPTDSPTAMDIGDESTVPPVVKPPPKKRKPNNPVNATGGPSKPPKPSDKGKEKAIVPHTDSPPSSSPIQKLASAIKERLPGLFSRDPDTTRRGRATSDPPRDHTPPQHPGTLPTSFQQTAPSHQPGPPETVGTDDADPLLTIKKSELEELVSRIVRQQQSDGVVPDKHAHRTRPHAIDLIDDDDYPPGDFRFSGSTPSSPGTFPILILLLPTTHASLYLNTQPRLPTHPP